MRNFDAGDQQFALQEDEVILSFSSIAEIAIQKRIRTAIFTALGVLDFFSKDNVVFSKDEVAKIKPKITEKFPDIEFVETEKQKIEIRIKQVQIEVAQETDHVSGEYHERWAKGEWASFGADISTCIGLAIELNTPKGKAKRPKWRVWFNKDTRYFEYRGEKLSWRDADGKLITLKALRAWKKEVNNKK